MMRERVAAWLCARKNLYSANGPEEEEILSKTQNALRKLQLTDKTVLAVYRLYLQLKIKVDEDQDQEQNQDQEQEKKEGREEKEKQEEGIPLEDICEQLGVPDLRSKFVDRIFGAFDETRTGFLSFRGFLVAYWNFCTLSNYGVAAHAVKIFEANRKEAKVTVHECDALIRMVHDVEETPADLRELCMGLGKGGQELVGIHELSAHCEAIFGPVYHLQTSLRKKVLGQAFWEEEAQRRVEQFGETVATEEILKGKRRASRGRVSYVPESHSHHSASSRPSTKSSSVVPAEEEEDGLGIDQPQQSAHPRLRQRALTNIDTLERCWKKIHQAEQRYVDCDMKELHDKARLKHELTLAVQHLLESQKSFFAQEEARLYSEALQNVEEQAEDFFALKQGQKHLKEVGREIALRRFQTDMFGRLRHKDLLAGMKIAREEYVSKYSTEATKEARAQIERKKHDLQRELEVITTEHKILSVVDERILDWQWERMYDTESGYHYFYCAAMEAKLWEEPHLPNVHGYCEEPGCKERAVIRCSSCKEEFCESCDRVIHSVGQKKNHRSRIDIPWEEMDWRKKAADVLLEHADKIQHPCLDLVEIERRRLA